MENSTPSAGKSCNKCGEWKPLTDFYRDSSRKDGRLTRCKPCANAGRAASVAKNSEHYRLYLRDWNAENSERRGLAAAARYQSNRDLRREQIRAWADANKEIVKRMNAKSYMRNREAVLERRRRWATDNPEAARIASAKRRSLLAGATIGVLDLDAMWQACESICYLCGVEMDWDIRHPSPLSKSLDHIAPLSKGGAHSQENLAWVHLRCNVKKGATDGNFP